MDPDFNNYVRFKDFCKFVKNHGKGKAYEDFDGNDSSFSSSDVFEDVVKGFWKKIDPERNCVVSCDAVTQFFHNEWNIDEDALKPIIKGELDGDGDG